MSIPFEKTYNMCKTLNEAKILYSAENLRILKRWPIDHFENICSRPFCREIFYWTTEHKIFYLELVDTNQTKFLDIIHKYQKYDVNQMRLDVNQKVKKD